MYELTQNASNEIILLLISRNPIPGLIRLLDHKDNLVVINTLQIIRDIIDAGIQSTSDTEEQHPLFDEFQEHGGIQKIFALFQKSAFKNNKNITAFYISQLFKAREITDQIMKQQIISHLKSLLSDSDKRIKQKAKISLKYLAQNEANRSEILNLEQFQQIEKDLKQPIEGTKDQKKQIIQKQEIDCLLLYSVLHGREDFKLRRDLINAGIIDVLLQIFAKRDLDDITYPFTNAFFVFTYP
ncbi:MAG: hypothetical protein EZS28_042721, partial [Streblomastix strix]